MTHETLPDGSHPFPAHRHDAPVMPFERMEAFRKTRSCGPNAVLSPECGVLSTPPRVPLLPGAKDRRGSLARLATPGTNRRAGLCFDPVSRREHFESIEKVALKPLPIGELEHADWKDATLHPDCYVYIDGDYYSAPHSHRHKKLRIKITENHVEIFLNLERPAIHPRSRHRNGKRIFIDAHFPPASEGRITKPRPKSCCRSPGSSTRI